MAVTALPRSQAKVTQAVGSVHPTVLLACLVVPALDLLAIVQPHAALAGLALGACGLGGLLLGVSWLRQPRAAWLSAAALAMVASGALRTAGMQEADPLSLLGVVALGTGGAFAAPGLELEVVLAEG